VGRQLGLRNDGVFGLKYANDLHIHTAARLWEYISMKNEPFKTKKSLGQHFLNSPVIPQRLCAAGAVGAGDTVVEIGPGTGALTRELLACGAHVVAIETDARAIQILEETFAEEIKANKLVISNQDARFLNLENLGLRDHGYKVVANIPYYLSGFLFRIFLEHPTLQPSLLVFLVQKEVALRIARDRKSSLLSLGVRVFGDPTYVSTVPRGHFSPPPRVDSAIVAVKNISRDRLGGLDPRLFFTILHLGFGQKRKQLVGNLAAQYDRAAVAKMLVMEGLPETSRAEDLSIDEWVTLVRELSNKRPA
jgi:16S rRNA (adenine1518-N6/adenine1519-N6)-dimethyltransferase